MKNKFKKFGDLAHCHVKCFVRSGPGSIPDESNALKFEFRHSIGRIMDGYSHLSEGRIGLHTYIKTLRKSLSKLWTIFT